MDNTTMKGMKSNISTVTSGAKAQQLESTDEFWADLEGIDDINAYYESICLDEVDLDATKLKSLSRKFSSIHSEEVAMHYKYSVPDGTGNEAVFISGQFNNWDFEEMTRAENGKEYSYEKMVKGGQIYNFYLFVDGEMKVDQLSKKTSNGKANWLFVPLGEKNMQKVKTLSEKPLQLRLAKLQKLSQEISMWSHEERTEKIAAMLKEKSQSYNKLVITINQDLLDRFLFHASSPHILHKVIDFAPATQEIKIQQLFDSNRIILNWKKFQNIQKLNLPEFLESYSMLERKDEDVLRQQLYHTKKFYFFIKYFADDGECLPLEIKPQVEISDYQIHVDQNTGNISYIVNRALRTEILFHDLVLNERYGYVAGTKVDIWTQVIDFETINIIHFHVNDTSDEVTLSVSYMHEEEEMKDFMTFGNDLQGRPLKYKVIVKDCKVFALLHKESADEAEVDEIPFEEHVVEMNANYISKENSDMIGQPRYFGTIESVPTGMISSADNNKIQSAEEIPLKRTMTTGCRSRGFEDLLGYVDFKVLSTCTQTHQIQQEPTYQALSICCLEIASPQQSQSYQDTYHSLQSSNSAKLSAHLQEFSQLLEQARAIEENKVDCTLQSDKAIIEQLNSMQSTIEDVAGEMEKSADNEAAIAQYEELDEEATTIIGRLVRRSRQYKK